MTYPRDPLATPPPPALRRAAGASRCEGDVRPQQPMPLDGHGAGELG
jgi:hypothetical protein